MIEQSDNECQTSDCPPPVFVPEGEKGYAQSDPDDESIIPINASEGALPNIPHVEENDAPVASDSASVADYYNPDEPDPEHLCQSKQIWEHQSGRLNKPTMLPLLLTLRKYLLALTDSSIRNSRENNTIIFGMRLVIPFCIPCI